MSDEENDLDLVEDLMEDYDLTPEDSIADLIEAIMEDLQEGGAHA